MPTLYIRRRETGDGVRYDVKYRRGGRYTPVEHAGSFRTQREAKLRLAFVGDMLAAGKDPKRELAALLERGRSFADVHAEWLASRRGVTDGTLDGYRHRGKRILEVFGDRGVDDITVRDVIAWVQALADVKKPGTVRLYVGQVRQVLDFAGVAINVPTKGNYGWILVEGKCKCQPLDNTTKGTPAIGDTMVTSTIGRFDDLADATAFDGTNQKLIAGQWIQAPADATSTLYLAYVTGARKNAS